MKTVNKIKEKKRKILMKPKLKNKKEKVLIVAQEIKFARLLSGNEKKTRDRVLKSFKKWLLNCFEKGYEFKEDDFTRVWKGLFYAVWMSDKPLVQEELCETIAGILDLFPPEQLKYALLMTKAGLQVLATEWYGIDQHRMDKFLMLVRRYQRGSLRLLRRCGWALPSCGLYADMLTNGDGLLAPRTPLYARNAGSMLTHFVDCFLEELAKVSEGEVPAASVTALLKPFCVYTCAGEAPQLCVACRRLLTALLRQTEPGLRDRERTRAWKQMGCPRGGPEALELASDEEDQGGPSEDEAEDYNSAPPALDPRAGRVDVVLHSVPVDAAGLADTLRGLLATAGSKAYKRIKICLQRFEQLAKDEYPLKAEEVSGWGEGGARRSPGRVARELSALEKKLLAASDELALRGLSRKHRKRALAKTRSEPAPDITSTNGDWAVEAAESKTTKKISKHKLNHANKENVHKERNAKKPKLADTQTDKTGNNKTQKHENKHKIQDKNETAENNTKQSNNNVKIESDSLKINNNKIKEKIDNKNQENKQPSVKSLENKPKLEKIKTKKEKLKNSNDSKQKFKKTSEIKQFQDKSNVKTKTIQIATKEMVKLQEKTNSYKLPTKDFKKRNGKIQKVEERPYKRAFETPKKVKFVLKNNSMQETIDYYKSVRQSPSIPYDGSKKPTKTNLKPSTPSPLNPFAKKKLRLK